jgi:hypothetical protein
VVLLLASVPEPVAWVSRSTPSYDSDCVEVPGRVLLTGVAGRLLSIRVGLLAAS